MSNIVPISPALLSLLQGAPGGGVVPFTREIYLISITVAGTSHIDNIEELAERIEPGTVLRMLRDPDNEYDSDAIAIYLEENQVGFVPMALNEIIARLMDAGKAFVCRVTDAEWRECWFRIQATISMIE